MEPVLIDGEFRAAQAPTGEFRATNPNTREPFGRSYPVSGRADVDRCLTAANGCVDELGRTDPDAIALFLEAFATEIEARAPLLIEMAHAETGLPKEPRLANVELPRTTNQLRLAAAAVRERSWVQATIDTRANLRSMAGPLGGPVLVFGPNNFPFAFNAVGGGDFVSAVAAKNPVIAKVHPNHPGTSQLLAEAALEALRAGSLPSATVQMLYALDQDLGLALVQRPELAAIGFTGGRRAGLALKHAADLVGKPISLELGSVNPVFVLAGALSERGEAIATELAGSCLLGAGQFCTNPGLSVVPEGTLGEALVARLTSAFSGAAPGTLLAESVQRGLEEGVQRLRSAGAEVLTGGTSTSDARFAFENTVLRIPGGEFLERAVELQTEVFGPLHLVVLASDMAEMRTVAERLEGNLTASVYTHTAGEDDAEYAALAPVLRRKVGRLLNDKMPTGVALSAAMNHGGPFPATGHPAFTSVGVPASFQRFTALHSYDAVRKERLPSELRDQNPTKQMWRHIDGVFTQADVAASPT
jgi:2,5-dioxopentanoate dehydrogenase